MTQIMGSQSISATPDNSDDESGEAFTDADFGDSDDEINVELDVVEPSNDSKLNETVNSELVDMEIAHGARNGFDDAKVNGLKNGDAECDGMPSARRDSHGDQNPSIVGILGGQQDHAEQRLAARRAARAEAREIRMRELERQQREQEDHADKAYDMYAETVGRRTGTRLTGLSPAALHSPRRSSEDSADDTFNVKDLRGELKEVEEKFRKAMILNAQLDNDKAALGYQLELLKDRIEELHEEYAQLQREHKEKCSAHERLKREHVSLERELGAARGAVRARELAAAAAGFAFVDAAPAPATNGEDKPDSTLPPLALVSHQNEKLLNDAGEGTLDVRLQKLLSSKQSLESEVRRLKLQLNEERHNGVARAHDQDLESELEALRKSNAEAKARAARAEAEAALQAAAAARLGAQLQRLKAQADARDDAEEQLKQERRKLQREAREALNRVEELETENSHLTKRLDKLKNAKSALLKEL
ncbi:leucine-rich repeat flightless-interacting protein 2 isoform X1 [Cydia splendana]|uniref:leucine-rich repeat flightless-interacting protein 2 isoform X1 n=1 Tax=Cydia splendana TaxID=1100963 RepID=UPI00300CA174